MSEISSKRLRYIDALKGFLMILVVLSHANGISGVWGVILCSCYMATFFMITGFTYKNKRGGVQLKDYIIKKAKRLLIPYFIYSFLLLLVDALFECLGSTDILRGIMGVLYARKYLFFDRSTDNIYLLDNGNSVLWFLPAMFCACILFWFIVNSDGKKRYLIIILYNVAAVVLSFLPILLPWSFDTAFSLSIVMYAGYCFRQHINIANERDKKAYSTKSIVFTITLIILYFTLISINGGVNISVRIYGNIEIISVLLFTIIGICGSLIYIIIFKAFGRFRTTKIISCLFEFLGKRSIVLMASHIAVFEMLKVILPQSILNIGWITMIIKLMVSVLLSAIGYEILVKLTPQIKILKYLY